MKCIECDKETEYIFRGSSRCQTCQLKNRDQELEIPNWIVIFMVLGLIGILIFEILG